jgi:hypothetical protein
MRDQFQTGMIGADRAQVPRQQPSRHAAQSNEGVFVDKHTHTHTHTHEHTTWPSDEHRARQTGCRLLAWTKVECWVGVLVQRLGCGCNVGGCDGLTRRRWLRGREERGRDRRAAPPCRLARSRCQDSMCSRLRLVDDLASGRDTTATRQQQTPVGQPETSESDVHCKFATSSSTLMLINVLK